jgi:hypothetical protein
MFLGDSSGEDLESFNTARSSTDTLATLSDTPETNPIKKPTKDDAEDWTDVGKDTLLVQEITDEQLT